MNYLIILPSFEADEKFSQIFLFPNLIPTFAKKQEIWLFGLWFSVFIFKDLENK